MKEPMAAVRHYIDAFNRGDAKDDVTGDSAYVVVPATMTSKVRGKQVTQTGAVFTVALRALADAWRIAAWAWAKGKR